MTRNRQTALRHRKAAREAGEVDWVSDWGAGGSAVQEMNEREGPAGTKCWLSQVSVCSETPETQIAWASVGRHPKSRRGNVRANAGRAFRVPPQSMAGAQSNCELAETIYSPPEERTKLIYHTEITAAGATASTVCFIQNTKGHSSPALGFRGRPPPGHRSHPHLLPSGDQLFFFF